MSFDLTTFKQSQLDTAVVEITDPSTGDPLGVKITLASPDSAKYREVSMAVQNKQLQFTVKNKGKNISAERLESNALDVLIGATVAWEGLLEEGKVLPCNPANVRKVYEGFPFIREQVDEFLGDRRNFFRK